MHHLPLHTDDQPEPSDTGYFHSALLLDWLDQARTADALDGLQQVVAQLRSQLGASDSPLRASVADDSTTTLIELRPAYLTAALDQITESRTLERARYYTERLIKSITQVRTSTINDINLNRWKEYEEIYTDSLWIINRRDSSGVHMADYWGNFIPQIPRQMLLRYTRKGEWVLDTFAGSGTTLIEGQRLGRNTLGIELQAEIAARAQQRIQSEPNPASVVCAMVTGDSTAVDYTALLRRHRQERVQLVIMHPPYFDIIKFSDNRADLSNAASLDDFLAKMGRVVDNVAPVLDKGRYLVLVIGDKYAAGEWLPLGFLTMQEVQKRGFLLKSIIVKNFEETTGKRNQKELWRYRALVGGFYVFKHEYIFLFQKH